VLAFGVWKPRFVEFKRQIRSVNGETDMGFVDLYEDCFLAPHPQISQAPIHNCICFLCLKLSLFDCDYFCSLNPISITSIEILSNLIVSQSMFKKVSNIDSYSLCSLVVSEIYC